MSFLSGSVTFSRYHVLGGSPKRLDENLMDKFRAHAIGKQRTLRSDREEVGWIGGRHVLDRDFDVEKNVILDCLHFGLRIDSARVPPEVLRAYVQMEFDALRKGKSAPDGKDNGRNIARLRKQAVDAARRRADEEIKQGRYQSMKQVPLLWDTREDVLYVGSAAPAEFERLYPLFKETFDRRLEPLSAGGMAHRAAEAGGLSRRLESLTPARVVAHPDGNGHGEVYWTASDPSSRDYLGNEFLLWLWYMISEESDSIPLADHGEIAVVIVKQLTLDCPWAEFGRIGITAEGPARLAESRVALQTGKLPRRAGLMISHQDQQYEFTLAAEQMSVLSGTLPKIEEAESGQARLEERIEQIRHLSKTLDLLFAEFLRRRLSTDWADDQAKLLRWLQPQREAMLATA